MCCVSAVASGTTVWGRVAGMGPFSLSYVPGDLNVALDKATRTQLGAHNIAWTSKHRINFIYLH